MITNDTSKENNILNALSTGIENSMILDNISLYTSIDGLSIPLSNIFYEKYRGIILENCVQIEMSDEVLKKYRYKPKMLSLKLYNCIDFWHMILWINNMTSVTEFNKKKIYVYDPEELYILDKILYLEKFTLADNKENETEVLVTDNLVIRR